MSGASEPARWGAFSSAPFRRYWLAAVARVFGLQFRFIGVGWLVASSDGLDLAPIWLGVVGVASSLPTIALSLHAGALADRYDPQRILMSSQAAIAVLSFGLAALIVMQLVTIEVLIVWALVVGTLTALSTPAQSAILPRLIDMREMTSAVALTSSVWNTMRIVGPAGAGLLIAAIGIGQAFFVTAGGFALSAALIASLPLEPLERDAGGGGTALLDGLRYVFRDRLFLATIGLSFFTSVFGMSYQTLLPIFAEDILSVGADGFGFLHTAAGVGALAGTLALLKVGSGRRAGPTMLASAALFGVFLSVFSRSEDLYLSMALLFCASFAASLYLNIGMVTLQVRVPDELRGRVMGIWSLTWFLGPVGGLPAGALAQWLGAPVTVMLGALSVSAFAVVLFGLSAELRRLPRADEVPA